MARDQQFCLRWNNYQTNLSQVFEQLLQSEKFVDVTLACDGHNIKAHRMVLSSCSTYFQSVLSESPCSHPVIILQGVKWSELKAIVEFMYKGEVNISQDQLSSLLRVAESLKIRGLAEVGTEDGEAIITSPSESPRVSVWPDETPRKRRRVSEEDRSRSRTPSPAMSINQSSSSAAEILEAEMPSRGSSVSNPSTSLPSPSPVASIASTLSSLAHLQAGPMPPPGPPLPPHLAHLPPLSPLSPLLNMHPMPRHHGQQDDFEIRPGIAEMIREEERAKLLESTHHWISNPMADSYQAQVQAAWQKSWNQTQSLLQNLRFRERGPLKSWRPETMADAIHAVLREGLSLSQAARKYDIPYPTFVLYANRVHNLLGPSHEPGDMRPKGRGRPQRILLGSWPEEQIKGVIRAVVFRDTAVLRDNDHKENKHPATTPTAVQVKSESDNSISTPVGTPTTPNSSNPTPSRSPDNRNTPSASHPSTSRPVPGVNFNCKDSKEDLASISISSVNPIKVANVSPSEESQSRPASSPSESQPNGHAAPSPPTSHAKFNGMPAPPGNSPNGQSNVIIKNENSPMIPRNISDLRAPAVDMKMATDTAARAASGDIRPHFPNIPGPQQLLGLIQNSMNNPTALANAPHLQMAARMFSEGSQIPQRNVAPNQLNAFHPAMNPRQPPSHPNMVQQMMLAGVNTPRTEDQDVSPEALLFGKGGSNERHFNNQLSEGQRQNISQFETNPDSNSSIEKQMLYRDSIETIKSEPEAIVN